MSQSLNIIVFPGLRVVRGVALVLHLISNSLRERR